MTLKQDVALVLARKSIPHFDSLPNRDKVLQIVAILADKIKVRENEGPNRGAWIDDFNRVAGVPLGSPWCGAMLTWAFDMFDMPKPRYGASVSSWVSWAKAHDLIVKDPKRADLCAWLNDNGTGHIGQIVSAIPGFIQSIEGNTTPGPLGNQRDGGGCYRRRRMKNTWEYFIRIV